MKPEFKEILKKLREVLLREEFQLEEESQRDFISAFSILYQR